MRCKCCDKWFDTSRRFLQPFSAVEGKPVEEDMCRACMMYVRYPDASDYKFYQLEDVTNGERKTTNSDG